MSTSTRSDWPRGSRELLASTISNSAALFAITAAISAAILGAIVAFVKLPSDRSSAAVSQAQGANEALEQTLAAVERERDYWREKWNVTHKEKSTIAAELMLLRHQMSGAPADDGSAR